MLVKTQAQKAGEEADRMITELSQVKPTGAPQTPTEPTDHQPVAAAVIAAAPVATPEASTDVTAPVAAAQPDSVDVSELRRETEAANQRWRVAQGMINKKDSEMETLRVLLAQASQHHEAAPAAPQKKAFITDKDEEDFGADHVDLGRRIASEVFHSMFEGHMAKLDARFNALEKSLGSVSDVASDTRADIFDAELLKQVPDWADINLKPEFLDWLGEDEGFSGMTRHQLLKKAYSDMDLKRTAKFFTAFKAESAPLAVAPVAPAAPVADASKYVAPGKSKASATPVVEQAQTKIWTSEAIKTLYSDKQNNRITPAEFAAQERDLFKAQSDGRTAA